MRIFLFSRSFVTSMYHRLLIRVRGSPVIRPQWMLQKYVSLMRKCSKSLGNTSKEGATGTVGDCGVSLCN